MKKLNTAIIGTLVSLLVSSHLYADCSFELFSISSTKDTKIIDFVEQLSDECEFTVIVTDPNANKFLNNNLNKTHLKNLTINEVFDIILKENNLSYTLENNLLRISYLTTKVFAIDYILSQRKSEGTTDITLSSSSDAKTVSGAASTSGGEGVGSQAESGMKITTNDQVKFWENLETEFMSVINRPHDNYTMMEEPIINKNAGLVTVTCTVKQMQRFEKYLKRLQEKVQLQVLIDVQILSVTMSDKQSRGIDWKQLYALQNLSLSADVLYGQNVGTFSGTDITTQGALSATGSNSAITSSLFKASGTASLNEVIKFLDTQGDVHSVSNPKVLTLNNQPALITVGTEYFYKLTSTETLAGGTTGTTSKNDEIKSVFAGVLLDITPEISDEGAITLKINPSISETTTDITSVDNSDRKMPPDLNRRQLSSVVTVKDGNRIILGGLINTKNSMNANQVPLLGDIPILGLLFKYEENVKSTEELVIIIEPHIIDPENDTLSLKDLGYKGLENTLLENNTTLISKKSITLNRK